MSTETNEVNTGEMFALVTGQGTGMHETALCGKCYPVVANQGFCEDRAQMAGDWDEAESWHDCSGNEALQCVMCGAPDFEGLDEL